jgi:hypothetical protein
MQTQKCSKCEKIYNLTTDFFHRSKKYKNGFDAVCKICVNSYRKTWMESTNYSKSSFNTSNGDEILARARLLHSGIISHSRELKLPRDKLINSRFIYNQLIKIKKCECCGIDFDFSYKGIANDTSPSIDRFFPEKGYVLDNIYFICFKCNIIKNNSSLKKLKEVLKWMKIKQMSV